MADPRTPPPVGSEDPLPPERSLPSYHDPTPETHRPISREDEAELALKHTEITPRLSLVVTVLFLLTIASLPAINLAARLRHEAHGHAPPGADLLTLLPSLAKIKEAHTWHDWDALIPTSPAIKAAEKNLEKDSIVSQYFLPRVQSVLTGALGAGNEQAYPGRDGWLFYRPDVDYIIGPPFLDPARLKQRARDLGIQPDPVKAIVDFKQQLERRGIKLLVVPVRAKPGVDPEMMSAGAEPDSLENPSFRGFMDRLSVTGVTTYAAGGIGRNDADRNRISPPAIHPSRHYDWNGPFYLATDTHWQPGIMEVAADQIANFVLSAESPANFAPAATDPLYKLEPLAVSGLGDIAGLLKLPPAQKIYARQSVQISQVQTEKGLWRPTTESEVLLLGDSFSNIYSLAAMGWGESAGLAEQISYNLNRPIDCILRNSDGAFATREMLSRELARGHDRLAGKKVVIWEFAERELMFGNWKLLPMALGQPKPAKFYSTPPAGGVVVTATVAATSAVPRPGTVPYKDHIFSVHLEEIEGTEASGNVQALAYLWSMRDNTWTAAAHWRPGDRVKVRLTEWPGVHPERDKINRSEFDDPALQLEEPVWAELVE